MQELLPEIRECPSSTRPLKKSISSAAIRSTPKRDVRAAVLRAFERRSRQIVAAKRTSGFGTGLSAVSDDLELL